MKKSVLIIGGAGFIGLNLLKNLAEKNTYKLSLADDFSEGQWIFLKFTCKKI